MRATFLIGASIDLTVFEIVTLQHTAMRTMLFAALVFMIPILLSPADLDGCNFRMRGYLDDTGALVTAARR